MRYLILLSSLPLLVATDAEIIRYRYADGSGNTYTVHVKEKIVEYQPIRRHESSSGSYDGGKLLNKKLDDSRLKQLVKSFHEALENKIDHIDNRIMTSGMLTVITKQQIKSTILKPKSESIHKIEKLLKNIFISPDT